MFSHRFHFLMRDSPTDFTHRSYGAFKGVHLSPLGFAACQSKKFTNTTKSIFSHRIQNTFLLGILPQISQIYTELLLRKLPQISQNTQNFLAEIFSHRFHRFTQNFLAEKNSVKSVDSVGSIRTLISVRICEICGSFFNYKLRVKSVGVFSTTNLEWILWGFSTTNFRKASVTTSWAQRYSGAVMI